MPYIKEDRRKGLKCKLDFSMKNPGELNYVIHQVLDDYLQGVPFNYQSLNDIVGALENVKLEFQRRLVAKFEDRKIRENGDIPLYSRVH